MLTIVLSRTLHFAIEIVFCHRFYKFRGQKELCLRKDGRRNCLLRFDCDASLA